MKKRVLILLIVALLTLWAAFPALAGPGAPVGGCPPVFELHHMMDHEGHAEHHIGLAQDLNGDGWICMMPLANGRHVHMDNVVR